jgi:hypothetical protein
MKKRNILWLAVSILPLHWFRLYQYNSYNHADNDTSADDTDTGATLNGRALAQTAVTLDASVVIKPD